MVPILAPIMTPTAWESFIMPEFTNPTTITVVAEEDCITAVTRAPSPTAFKECRGFAEKSGGTITLTEDVEAGTKDADVICTDVWVSMGEPDEVWEERIRELTPYKVTKQVMENAGEQAIFLHCLPAFHDLETVIGKEMGERFGITDMEVTDEVFESPQSVVFDEAENRMHTIKAVMAATLGA